MKASIFLAALLATSLPAAALAKSAPAKPTIVLVHGAWETSGIWSQVVPILEHDGYIVRTVDLPGRPTNPQPIPSVTMDSYRAAVDAVVSRERAPVVLVGHSFAGFVISTEAEARPSKIRTLVYVAAYVPKDGDSLLKVATADAGSKAGEALVVNEPAGIASIKYELRGGLFANDAPPQVGDLVAKGVVDEPLAPLATPVHLTAQAFGSVDKAYIHTSQDHVVSPGLQASMVAATPVRVEYSIDTGHTPFITQPAKLAALIEQSIK
jgi:pimeloyl-ACP methyl ester carboxylesterase